MTRLINVIAQIVLGGGQVMNLFWPVLGERQKAYVAGGLALGQLIISAIASAYNPDGTKAQVAYEPAKK